MQISLCTQMTQTLIHRTQNANRFQHTKSRASSSPCLDPVEEAAVGEEVRWSRCGKARFPNTPTHSDTSLSVCGPDTSGTATPRGPRTAPWGIAGLFFCIASHLICGDGGGSGMDPPICEVKTDTWLEFLL